MSNAEGMFHTALAVHVTGHSLTEKRHIHHQHVMYHLRVRHINGCEWMVKRRYQELDLLHDQLKTLYSRKAVRESLPAFPPKRRLLKWKDVVEARRAAFDSYLQAICSRGDIVTKDWVVSAFGMTRPEKVNFRVQAWLPLGDQGLTAVLEVSTEQKPGSAGPIDMLHVRVFAGEQRESIQHLKFSPFEFISISNLPPDRDLKIELKVSNPRGYSQSTFLSLKIPSNEHLLSNESLPVWSTEQVVAYQKKLHGKCEEMLNAFATFRANPPWDDTLRASIPDLYVTEGYKVLVLEGTGLLGRALLHELWRRGFQITTTSSEDYDKLHEKTQQIIKELDIVYFRLELGDPSLPMSTFSDAVRSIQLVINLAADRGSLRWDGEKRSGNNVHVNSHHPDHIVEIASKWKVPMIHVSANDVWSGRNNTIAGYPPVAIDQDDRFLKDIGSSYGLQMRNAERKISGCDLVTVIRFPVLYGEMLHPLEDGVASAAIDNYLDKNNFKHDTWRQLYPTSTSDCACILAALANKALTSKLCFKVYNYGAQTSVSMYDFMQLFKEASGLDVAVKSDDAGRWPVNERPPQNQKLCIKEIRAELMGVHDWHEPRALCIPSVHAIWGPHFRKRISQRVGQILILNGTGLLGRYLVTDLRRRGFFVTVTSPKALNELHESVIEMFTGVDVVKYMKLDFKGGKDISDPLQTAVSEASLVVNLMEDGTHGRSDGPPSDMNRPYANTEVSARLAELAAEFSVPVIHLSSDLVWSGASNNAEGYPPVPIDEDSRFAQEAAPGTMQRLDAERQAKGNSWVIVVRCAVLYGRMVDAFEDGYASDSITNYLCSNDRSHDTWQCQYPTHADDCAFILGALVKKRLTSGLRHQVYNYGAQTSVSKYAFISMFKQASNLHMGVMPENAGCRPPEERPPENLKLNVRETRIELSEVDDWREPRILDVHEFAQVWGEHFRDRIRERELDSKMQHKLTQNLENVCIAVITGRG